MTELVRSRPRRRSWPRVQSLFQDLMSEAFFPSWDEEMERPSVTWAPRMDLIETGSAYELQIDLPGLTKDDVSIDVEDHRLVVHGHREETTREEEANVLRMERPFDRFYRSLTLPDAAQPEKAEATLRDGVLTVRVPKAEAKKPKKISIQ